MATTKVPGEDSFTSALIYALEALVEEKGRFTTVELLRKIKLHAPKFPKDQTPVLSDRKDEVQAGRIMLHPLNRPQKDGSPTELSREENTNLRLIKRQIVTLHLDFADQPSLADIETLGRQLNQVFERYTLSVNRVRWGGMKPSLAARAVGNFRAAGLKSKRRASMQQQRVPLEDGGSVLQSVEDNMVLITPSPSDGNSPARLMESPAAASMAIDPPNLKPISFPKSLQSNEESKSHIEDRGRRHKKRKSDVDSKDSV